MGTANIGMCLLQVLGNVTCAVVRSMSVVMHHLTYVHDVDIKGVSTNTVHECLSNYRKNTSMRLAISLSGLKW